MTETTIFNTGFLGLLTILFIGLKLTGYIEWSWFWVLSPLAIPLIFVLSILIGILGLLGVGLCCFVLLYILENK